MRISDWSSDVCSSDLEDHAVRACYAALGMQDAVKRYSEELQRTHGLSVHIRVGLNSGEVVVRSIGRDLRMDYTAVGQTTHLAARMEIGRASGRERVCQYVWISVFAGSLKKKKQ